MALRPHLTRPLRSAFIAALLILALSAGAAAHSWKHGDLVIGHAWAAPSASGQAVIHLAISNRGRAPAALVGARSPLAEQILLLGPSGGALPRVELAPGRPVALRPGATRIVMTGLPRKLRLGEEVPLTLLFDGMEPLAISVSIANGPSH